MQMEKNKKKKKVKIEIAEEKKSDSNIPQDELNHIRRLLDSRQYSAYSNKEDPRTQYEAPLSDREWWRVTLRETPVPGTYRSKDFLQLASMNPIKATYNFAGEGRQRYHAATRDGGYLLPGAYRHKDFSDNLKHRRLDSCFKSSGRSMSPGGFQDKDLKIPPWQYDIVRPSTTTTKLSSFKSQSTRFPSSYFKPRDGPPPGAYNPRHPCYRYEISSSFRSATPRFKVMKNKDPGPGTYEATTFSVPQKMTLQKMAKMHGLFFRQTFET